MTTERSGPAALESDIASRPGRVRCVTAEELEGQERTPERHALEPALEPGPERPVRRERREEPEALQRRGRQARLLHRPEHGARAHVEDPLVTLPAHPRG